MVLIQHNPNEGLKPERRISVNQLTLVLIQHNPNEGLKLASKVTKRIREDVLIQHNPNEGLKHLDGRARDDGHVCSFSTTRTRD